MTEPTFHTLSKRVGLRSSPNVLPVYKIALVGAGGSGSQMVTCLARLDRALRALNLGTLAVDLYEPDRVSVSNIGRQLFYSSEVGQYKASALIHRANLSFGVQWQAMTEAYTGQCFRSAPSHFQREAAYDFLITCVDTGAARRAIHDALTQSVFAPAYWLDLGNEDHTGQVLLGEPGLGSAFDDPTRLRTVVEKWPEFFDGTVTETDIPSCSLADALLSQDLFINDHVARWAAHLLWTLLRTKKTDTCGYFINLRDGRVIPIPVPNISRVTTTRKEIAHAA